MNGPSNASERSVDLMRDPHAPTALTELARASAVANDASGMLWVLRYTGVATRHRSSAALRAPDDLRPHANHGGDHCGDGTGR
jgi:hypothetical protein